MKVFITGAGLVGCHLAQALDDHGHQAVLYDIAPVRDYVRSVSPRATLVQGDVGDLPTLIDTLREHQVDVVVHTAFLIGRTINRHPFKGMHTNLDGVMALAEAVRLVGVRRFLFASTFGIYRWDLDPQQPITEDFPVGGDGFYAASKIACERVLAAFARHYGFEHASIRFGQIYGPGHYAGGDTAGPAMDAALRAALAGQPVALDPGPLSINDYVYARDIAAGVMHACERPLAHTLYHLGSGRLGTPEDVAAAIRSAVPGSQVSVLPAPVEGPYWRHEQPLDLTRVRQDLGYEPAYDLQRGVADFVSFLRGRSAAS